MMRAESSILGLVEIVSGVAIAAAVREIGDSSCRSHLRSVVMAPSCSRTQQEAWQLWHVWPSPTRPQEVIGFEELLSELIARARLLCPYLDHDLSVLR